MIRLALPKGRNLPPTLDALRCAEPRREALDATPVQHEPRFRNGPQLDALERDRHGTAVGPHADGRGRHLRDARLRDRRGRRGQDEQDAEAE